MSEGFFLFSSAKTTVISLPSSICPSIWYFASEASSGSKYWMNPNPLGSLKQKANFSIFTKKIAMLQNH
jgi:hypothetical protein